MSKNHVIGKNNLLPWRLPEDLSHFKEITMGHPIVMGRKTYESIGKPLPGRTNIVLTRNISLKVDPAVKIIHSLEDLENLFSDTEEIFIIGGADLFKLALPKADKIYLTRIEQKIEGDTYFPEVDLNQDFNLVYESKTATSSKTNLPYRFLDFQRKQQDHL